MSLSFSDILPDQDYRFDMRIRHGSIADALADSAARAEVLAERQSWLTAEPEDYAVLLPEAEPLLNETIELLTRYKAVSPSDAQRLRELAPETRCTQLGMVLEPDYLLLKPDPGTQEMVLLGGALCFPTNWDINEKLGHTLDRIHGGVPGLNAAIGEKIRTFLHRLKPETAWHRINWGFYGSDERNLHVKRKPLTLTNATPPDLVRLRIEHQSFIALPASGGMLFLIRIATHTLREIHAHPATRQSILRAIRTMPPEMQTYKGIAAAQETICRYLESA